MLVDLGMGTDEAVAADPTLLFRGLHYAVVLANADGSPGVSAESSWLLALSTKSPNASRMRRRASSIVRP